MFRVAMCVCVKIPKTKTSKSRYFVSETYGGVWQETDSQQFNPPSLKFYFTFSHNSDL